MLTKPVLLTLTAVLAIASTGAALADPVPVATSIAAPAATHEVADAPVAPELPPELHCPAAIRLPTTVGGVEVPASMVLEECGGCELNAVQCLLKEDCSNGDACDAQVTLVCLLALAPFRCGCVVN